MQVWHRQAASQQQRRARRLTTRPMSTAAASWSKPWMRSPMLLPSTHLQAGRHAGAQAFNGGKPSRATPAPPWCIHTTNHTTRRRLSTKRLH